MSDVSVSGPLFDGRAEAAAEQAAHAIRHDLADEGERMVREAFASSIRDDHGVFLASITTIDSSRTFTTASGHKSYSLPAEVPDPATEVAVTTELATYGPWLEGVGSRNATTRFKGYHGFRRAAQELDGRAGATAEETLRPYVEEMNA